MYATGGDTILGFVQCPTGYDFEILHYKQRDPLCQVMLYVRDLEKSIKFYEAMGMSVLRTEQKHDEKCTIVFLGFGAEADNTVVELTHNWGDHEYTAGNGYSQIAISTPDVIEKAKELEGKGIPIANEGPVAGIGNKACAVHDPDGWKTVLVEAEA